MISTQLWQFGARELAEGIRKRTFSSVEAVQAHLERIERVNRSLNAITRVLEEEGLATAAEVDAGLARGDSAGPLAGVPFTVKENIDLAGTATTWGLAALAAAEAPVDAPQVANLRQAGAIPIGRSNLPDFALRWHTDNGLHGATINPFDPSLTPGGSSGGEAVALATGMTPLGLGNDLGGSLRWPAQCCGVASIRPTLGRVPSATVIEPSDPLLGIQLMNVQGPMARKVDDLRLALQLMSRPSDRDPWYVPAPLANRDNGQLRVAVVRDPGGAGVEPSIAEAVDRAARALRESGHTMADAEPPGVAEAARGWGTLIAADVERMTPLLQQLNCPDANRFLEIARQAMPAPGPEAYSLAFAGRHGLLRAWAEFFRSYDVVLAPIATMAAFPVGADLDPAGAGAFVTALRMVVAVNYLGLPSAAVPLGDRAAPQAVQLIGPRYREDLCLDAAEAVERVLGVRAPVDPRHVTSSSATPA
jgi:amidase